MPTSEPAFARRFRTEEILEVHCPKCGARPHDFCNRDQDRLSAVGRSLRSRGTPPSHTERLWLRQGHDPSEFAAMRAKIRPFKEAEVDQARTPRGGWTRDQLAKWGVPWPPPAGWKRELVAQQVTYPRRYQGERLCPGCQTLRIVDVVVMAPASIAYRCDCGHKWMVRANRKQVA